MTPPIPFYHSLCQSDQSSMVNVLLCSAQPAACNLLTTFHETVVCDCLEHIYLFRDLCASCYANLYSATDFFLTKKDNWWLVIIGQKLSDWKKLSLHKIVLGNIIALHYLVPNSAWFWALTNLHFSCLGLIILYRKIPLAGLEKQEFCSSAISSVKYGEGKEHKEK